MVWLASNYQVLAAHHTSKGGDELQGIRAEVEMLSEALDHMRDEIAALRASEADAGDVLQKADGAVAHPAAEAEPSREADVASSSVIYQVSVIEAKCKEGAGTTASLRPSSRPHGRASVEPCATLSRTRCWCTGPTCAAWMRNRGALGHRSLAAPQRARAGAVQDSAVSPAADNSDGLAQALG